MEVNMLLWIITLIFVGYIHGAISRGIGRRTQDAADFTQLVSRHRRQSNPMPNCGYAIVSSSDKISSPRFPRRYGANLHCNWMITVPADQVIHIRFEAMDISRGKILFCDVDGDYLKIQDMDRAGDLLGFYCGQKIPASMISTSNRVWMTFNTDADSTGAGAGFQLTFTGIEPPPGLIATITPTTSKPPVLGLHLNSLNIETGIGDVDLIPDAPPTDQSSSDKSSADEDMSSSAEEMSSVLEEGSSVSSTTKISSEQDQLQTSPPSTESVITERRATEQGQMPTMKKERSTTITSTSGIARMADLEEPLDTTPATTSRMPTAARRSPVPLPSTTKPSKCWGVLVEPSGNFTSPSYPEYYDSNVICTWTILADPLEYIALRFIDFDIDNPMPDGVCDVRYSYIRITYFDSTDRITSDKFCGSILPLNITISHANQMVVYFFSELGVGKGFVAEYDVFHPDPAIDGAPVFPDRQLQSEYEYLYDYYSSDDWSVGDYGETDVSNTCGDIISTSGSVLVSPGYPYGYKAGSSCVWIVLAKATQYIKLEFSHFNVGVLSEGDNTCYSSSAVVTVSYNDLSGRFMSENLCGSIDSPPVIVAMSDQMQVSFTSRQRGKKGFRAEVAFLDVDGSQNGGNEDTNDNVTPTNPQKTTTDVVYDMGNVALPSPGSEFCKRMHTECCYDLSQGSSRGVIASPGYPSGYDNYLNCKWLIKGDTHQSISLRFTTFELDSVIGEHEDCAFDKALVRVVYFNEYNEMKERFFCGGSLPSTVVSNFHTLYVEFYTFGDPRTSDRGFKAVYSKDTKSGDGPTESTPIDIGGHIFRGLVPFLPIGDDLNGPSNTTLVPTESSHIFTVEDRITLKPRVTKRRRPGGRGKPNKKKTKAPGEQSISTTYNPNMEVTADTEDEDGTIHWSASLNYESDIEVTEPNPELLNTESSTQPKSSPQPLPDGTPVAVRESGEENVTLSAEKSPPQPSSDGTPVAVKDSGEENVTLSAEPVAWSNGRPPKESEPSTEPEPLPSEVEPSAAPEPLLNSTLQSGSEPSAELVALKNSTPASESDQSEPSRTAQSHDIFTTTAASEMDGRTPYQDDKSPTPSMNTITEDAQNTTKNGSADSINVGGRFISLPVVVGPTPESPDGGTPMSSVRPTTEQVLTNMMDVPRHIGMTSALKDTTELSQPRRTTDAMSMTTKKVNTKDTQTRLVIFICVGIGVALLLVLFILLVYCTMAKRRVTDSMDLAQERTNYWQSYQAYDHDGPEWVDGDRVQEETPKGRRHEEIGFGGGGRGKKKSTYPERLI